MVNLATLAESISTVCGDSVTNIVEQKGELTIEVLPEFAVSVLTALRDNPELQFDQLIDLCGVDYSTFGTDSQAPDQLDEADAELAVVYHLLSVSRNTRLRVRIGLDRERPMVPSVVDIWPVANWFEREAFDLFGMVFHGHPDLRRILTDYGFIGHPFRKDFPMSGHVEMRYDEAKGRVVYQPVSIDPRVLVPRVIREEGYGG